MKGENLKRRKVAVYKDLLMIMKREDKKDNCHVSTTHDKNLVQTVVQENMSRRLE